MVFHLLSSTQETHTSIIDIWQLSFLVPPFNLQPLIAKTIDKNDALCTWIQLMCLYETNKDAFVQHLDTTSSINVVNKILASEDFKIILDNRYIIRQLYSDIDKKWNLQRNFRNNEDISTENFSLTAYYIEHISDVQFGLLDGNLNKKLPYINNANGSIVIVPCAIFLIQSMNYDVINKLCHLNLTLYSQDDWDTQNYLNFFIEKKYVTDAYIFGVTLNALKEYQLATDFLFEQLKLFSTISYRYLALLQLLADAILHAYIDDPSASLTIIWLALNTYKILRNVENIDGIIIPLYLTLGDIYCQQNSLDKALVYYEKIENRKKISIDFDCYSPKSFLSIGYVHEMMRRYMSASMCYEYYRKILINQLQISEYSIIIEKHGENIVCIEHRLKRLESRYLQNVVVHFNTPETRFVPFIQKILDDSKMTHENLMQLLVKYYYRSMRFDHKMVAELYSVISRQHLQDRQLFYAINSRKMAINIRSKYIESTSDLLAIDYYYLHYKQREYTSGMEKKYLQFANINIKKAIQIQRTIRSVDHILLAESYNVQGVIFIDLEQYNLALVYLNQALSIYKKWASNDHPKLGFIYKSIGIVCLRKKMYTKTINYLEQALINTKDKKFGEIPNQGQIYKLLTFSYYYLHDYDKALKQMKILIKFYREKVCDKDDFAIEILEDILINGQEMTFIQIYEQINHIIHFKFDKPTLEEKFDFDYGLLSRYDINVPVHICIYDE
ncbi:hypothetical protein I4U23_016547 [Adineta vaga]|nr:hypothetical protein I4U23_016547 [Adineta vaga]